jgi:peptidoglycan/xylan/chitin deacetylase (PgdA/CDA1 family)
MEPTPGDHRMARLILDGCAESLEMSLKNKALRAGLTALRRSGAHRLLEPFARGAGLIYMLHRVKPAETADFAPNAILEVTPEFLDQVIAQTRDAGLDIVTLDEAAQRLAESAPGRFACFTFDDGYRDNAEHALPVFQAHDAPFTVYVPTDFPDGRGEFWWVALEEAIAASDAVSVVWREGAETYECAAPQGKWAAFESIYWRLRTLPEDEARAHVRKLAADARVDMQTMCRDLVMDWDALRLFASDPLVTIGAHTAGHYAVAKLDADRAEREMRESRDRIERELGARPRHFSFPYGDPSSAGARDFAMARKLGFTTAVTTRKGMLHPGHRDHLTALPRVSLNGDFQSLDYTALYLGGAPFALLNRFRQVDAA